MTEILFARKTDVDAFSASIAALQATLAAADFVTGTAQAGLGAERVATTSTSIVTTLAAGIISWERAALTGDITAAQNSNATTLATVNANVGSFGLAASVAQFTVNAKGLITAAVNVPISITSGAVSDFTEAAQDAVGAAMGNTATINHTYNDPANTITADVNTNSIGNTHFRQGLARSVVGVTGNATANVADIQGTADQVLRVNTAGTALAFGTVATGGIADAAVTYAKIQNVAASRLLGNPTGGVAAPSEIDLNATLAFSGTSLQRAALTGDATAAAGSNAVTVLQASTSWALPGDISPAQITADQNDYNPTGLSTASTLRLFSDATRNITGLAGGADGRILIIHNIGPTNAIILKDESGSSTAANRFALTADVTLTVDTVAEIQYDSTSARWRMIGGTGGGGGGAATTEPYVTIGNSAGLSAERALTAGAGVTITDGGANTTVTIAIGVGPTKQWLTSGTGATYTTPAGARALHIQMVGGGGGGGAPTTNVGSNGGTTTFNSINANGGTGGPVGGVAANGGAGGTGGTGSAGLRIAGGQGGPAGTNQTPGLGDGGSSYFGGRAPSRTGNVAGLNAATNSGGGGSGGGLTTTPGTGGGGGGGEYVEFTIASPAASYTYSVGTAGAGGAAGGNVGGNGGSGLIIVTEYY